MKQNHIKFPSVFVLLVFLSFGAQSVSGQALSAPSVNSVSPDPPELKQITRVSSQNTASGSRVMLTFNGAITDYGAYRNGDKFLVLIPGAELALSEIVVKGDGFSNSKVEARGTNLAFSFQLESDVKASVSENGNQLEVFFSRSPAA